MKNSTGKKEKKMKRKDSKTITVDLSLNEYESLKKISAVCQISVTRLIRDMIERNIEGRV